MSFARLKVRRKFFTGLFAFPKLFPPPHRLSNRTQQKGPLHVSKESLLTSYLITEQARFYRWAYSYLKNREEALDAVQTAVCRAWEQQDRLREPEAVRTWFYRILLNESMNHHRRAKRLVPLEDTLLETPVPARDPGERLDLYDAIERLDWKEQTVVRLRFFEDMKLEEIARVTNTNLNTVKSRLYKSLRRLRELTEEEC